MQIFRSHLRLAVLFWIIFPAKLFGQQPPGELILIRKTGPIKSAQACKVYLGDSLIAEPGEKSCVRIPIPPGSYKLNTETSLEKEKGKAVSLTIESGKAHFYECKLYRRSTNSPIPSAGYYFVLSPLSTRKTRQYLKEKFIIRDLKESLLEEYLEKHGPD